MTQPEALRLADELERDKYLLDELHTCAEILEREILK